MKKISVKNEKFEVPSIALGCMRLSELETEKAVASLIDTAMEEGINFFDHADIYGDGRCEELFGKVVSSNMREKMLIQTKCGIRKGICYDFSKEHILKSVEGSLKRLQTDYIDVLLLHRPDPLFDFEEVAEAFSILEKGGKVKYFGVSNHNVMQMELMNQCLNGKILFNQMQYSIVHSYMIDTALTVNTSLPNAVDREGGVLEYCRLHKITMQSWSPFYGSDRAKGVFIDNKEFEQLNIVLKRLAERYGTNVNAIAVAWIMRHPANIQTIIGTTKESRLKEVCEAGDVVLTREEWYELYLSAGKILP